VYSVLINRLAFATPSTCPSCTATCALIAPTLPDFVVGVLMGLRDIVFTRVRTEPRPEIMWWRVKFIGQLQPSYGLILRTRRSLTKHFFPQWKRDKFIYMNEEVEFVLSSSIQSRRQECNLMSAIKRNHYCYWNLPRNNSGRYLYWSWPVKKKEE